jgi:hypothetical protein
VSRRARVKRDPRAAAPAETAAPPSRGRVAPLSLLHPAMLFVIVVASALVVLAVTNEIVDFDWGQHLAVGRFIWERHQFPTTQLWTWPTYGAKDVDYAWGFEALVWPLWKLGGVLGLYVWRWVVTLAALGLAWAAARRMGARGLTPLVVLALAAMTYRYRAWVRPETLAGVLLAAEILVLESRRHGSRTHLGWLVLIAWIWANVHISYYLFFVVLGIQVLAPEPAPRAGAAPSRRALLLAGLAALAVMFLNPSGWRTLWQPFEYWLVWRHETIYASIAEMLPLQWNIHVRDGLPILFVAWPVLALLRARRRGLDPVELLMCAIFSATVLAGQRFISVYVLAAGIYLARDIDEQVHALRAPAWTAPAWARAGLAAGACLIVTAPELSRPDLPIRLGLAGSVYPVRACDFIERTGLRGRIFNPYEFGGYLVHRFWPEQERLPFMGIHQEGSKELRALYVVALSEPAAWSTLESRYAPEILVVRRMPLPGENLLSFLDADSTWARVFADDVAFVYVRTGGRYARLAADSAYRVWPADPRNVVAFERALQQDSTLRRRAEPELAREIAGSPRHALALVFRRDIAMAEGRWEDANRFGVQALAVEPGLPVAREVLGLIALERGRPREALGWFEAEVRRTGDRRWLDFHRGQVAQAEGDLQRARRYYQSELKRFGDSDDARDSLNAVSRRLGP